MPQSIVMKFGGSSVEDASAFRRVARIIAERLEQRPVVVVSAMSGMTDALLAAVELAVNKQDVEAADLLQPYFAKHAAVTEALLSSGEAQRFNSALKTHEHEVCSWLKSLSCDSSRRASLQDAVLAAGEQLSSTLLAATLRSRAVNAITIDARRCIVTDDEFGNATPLLPETTMRTQAELCPALLAAKVPVLGGFMGSTAAGVTTTLGRGGSDYTASIVGAAISAREIQIWTDVPGVLTADPRVVPRAVRIPRLSYAEAAELAYFGAKVLHPKTIQPAVEGAIPVRICNSRAPDGSGTLVCAEIETAAQTVKAIAHKTGITTVQVSSARMLGAYGFLRAIFEVFDRHRTVVDVVTTSEVSVSLSLDDAGELDAIVAELELLGTVSVETERAMICVVGAGLRGTPGIAARVFSTISDINVMLISQGSSSINLTFVIEERQLNEAVARLHETFFAAREAKPAPIGVPSRKAASRT
ncbi:MAG TPA: lysine-sensitive aspartokinase 3 [Pyrinomonadaceae bacterium]|nr:lysine-sensitive aspartokinase 3 [Pyrinomonadaceae bacterium]